MKQQYSAQCMLDKNRFLCIDKIELFKDCLQLEMAAAYTTEVESPSVKALQQCHPELRQYLNFATLLPYLSKYGLITKEQQEELIEVPIYTTAQKADKLLSWLPRSRPDFLERFIQSLRESTEGTNHDELADSLEEALQEARNDTDEAVILKDFAVSDTVGLFQEPIANRGRHPTLTHMDTTTMLLTCCQNVRRHYKWILCYSILLTIILLMVSALSVLSRVPSLAKTVEPHEVASGTMELHFGLYDTWIKEVTMDLSHCVAAVLVIPDLSCKKLSSMYTYNHTIETKYEREFFYLLPGSVIHFNISEDADMDVWVFADYDSYSNALYSPELYDCNNPSSNALCFKTGEHPGTYEYKVTKASFYFLVPEHFDGISWHFDVIAYNYTKLTSVYTPQAVLSGSPETIQLVGEGDYTINPVCVIMQLEDYACPSKHGTLTVTDIKRRQDVLLYPGLLLLLATLSAVITVTVHCAHIWRQSARRRRQRDIVIWKCD